jgi:RND family efflux transporter MFP subunit
MRADRLACAAIVALTACKRAADSEPAPGPKAVRCADVQSATVKEMLEVRGTVAPPPDREAQVASQVVGRLLRVEVREGDEVNAGQIVARIDDAALVDAAHQADAARARARAEHDNAQTSLARIQRVFERGIAARQEVDDAAAREASAKATEMEADAAARVAHRQIDRAAVRSPLGGLVLKVLRQSGELVDGTPATPIVDIADVSDLELVADVPAQDLVRLSRGALATLKFPALPERPFQGYVSRVASSVDRATGVGSARVHIDPADPPRPPIGAFGTAVVESGASRQALLVPAAALRSVSGGEGEVVACGSDHVAHVRKVHPGPARNALVEVSGEIAAGERVAVEPVLGISDGDSIEENEKTTPTSHVTESDR